METSRKSTSTVTYRPAWQTFRFVVARPKNAPPPETTMDPTGSASQTLASTMQRSNESVRASDEQKDAMEGRTTAPTSLCMMGPPSRLQHTFVVGQTQDVRARVQMARIDRRWSIDELAARAQCPVDVLAAFERGDEVVSDDTLRRIKTTLRLT